MMGFDDTDLLEQAERVGFSDITVTLELSSTQQPSVRGLLDPADEDEPHPESPTFGEAIRQALATDQAAQLKAYLSPTRRQWNRRRHRSANAYLTAVRPGS